MMLKNIGRIGKKVSIPCKEVITCCEKLILDAMSEILTPSIKLLRTIADETRLKILLILSRAEFTVGEMVQILGIHQSNTSRHLSQLRESQLAEDRREGAVVYYRWSEALRASTDIQRLLRDAWLDLPDHDAVQDHIQSILAHRRSLSQKFFDSVDGRYRKLKEPGGGAEAILRAFGNLLQFNHAVDIGCGEGDIAMILAKGCRLVTAVDQSRKMLDQVAERARTENLRNIVPSEGLMESLPLPDSVADLVIMSQVLHHAPAPEEAIREAFRVLAPKGRFVLIDLAAHDQEWVREHYGDLWLGFQPTRIESWLLQLSCNILQKETIHMQEGLPAFYIIAEKH